MNLITQYAYLCRKCSCLVPISPPPAIGEEIRRGLAALAPTGILHPPLFVACPGCAVVYPCKLQDLNPFPVETAGLPAGLPPCRPRPTLIQARRKCGTDECGTLAEIHTIVPRGTTREEALRIAATWNFQELVCLGCRSYLRECLAGDYEFYGLRTLKNLD